MRNQGVEPTAWCGWKAGDLDSALGLAPACCVTVGKSWPFSMLLFPPLKKLACGPRMTRLPYRSTIPQFCNPSHGLHIFFTASNFALPF